jgi:hypothetical protein
MKSFGDGKKAVKYWREHGGCIYYNDGTLLPIGDNEKAFIVGYADELNDNFSNEENSFYEKIDGVIRHRLETEFALLMANIDPKTVVEYMETYKD